MLYVFWDNLNQVDHIQKIGKSNNLKVLWGIGKPQRFNSIDKIV